MQAKTDKRFFAVVEKNKTAETKFIVYGYKESELLKHLDGLLTAYENGITKDSKLAMEAAKRELKKHTSDACNIYELEKANNGIVLAHTYIEGGKK